jgi:predicted Rossmann fold flavoprotein
MKYYDVIIAGGGAAGFFAAINIAENNPNLKVVILERSSDVLSKVKVSGGGRCNITHAEFDPQELAKNYPRGEKELLGPFHTFMTGDTMAWFNEKGINLKIEEDGRIFPESNSSQTIIDCFHNEVNKYKVEVLTNHSINKIQNDGRKWIVSTKKEEFSSEKLLIATGSSQRIWTIMQQLGHTIISPVPSLFTFNIKDDRIDDIQGVVVHDVEIKVLGTNLTSNGPLLITHVGMSAPSILKLSAFGAIQLAEFNYKFIIEINFVRKTFEEVLAELKEVKDNIPRKIVNSSPQFQMPKRLWRNLVIGSGIEPDVRWADLNRQQLESLASQLTKAVFSVEGKSTFKEEFVTAGGINLKEVNFKSFESKLFKNLFFAGEVLNIDAVTGGFNFQNAWTGAFIAAKHISG